MLTLAEALALEDARDAAPRMSPMYSACVKVLALADALSEPGTVDALNRAIDYGHEAETVDLLPLVFWALGDWPREPGF